jgi:hypothetical protein
MGMRFDEDSSFLSASTRPYGVPAISLKDFDIDEDVRQQRVILDFFAGAVPGVEPNPA